MNLVEVLEISGEASRQYPSTLRRWRRAPPEKAGTGILSALPARVCVVTTVTALFLPRAIGSGGTMGLGGGHEREGCRTGLTEHSGPLLHHKS